MSAIEINLCFSLLLPGAAVDTDRTDSFGQCLLESGARAGRNGRTLLPATTAF